MAGRRDTRVGRAGIGIIVVVLTGTAALAGPGTAGAAPAGTGTPAAAPALCAPTAVQLVVTTNRTAYTPGQTVVLHSSIRNVSTTPCSVWLGLDPGFSPSFVVVNAKDKEVWDRCDVQDQPGACFDILVAHRLNPGQSFRAKARWDQGSAVRSQMPRRVHPGTYTFVTHYQNIPGIATQPFTIARAHRH